MGTGALLSRCQDKHADEQVLIMSAIASYVRSATKPTTYALQHLETCGGRMRPLRCVHHVGGFH